MIESMKDLGLSPDDDEEKIGNKLKDKLGVSLDDVKKYLCEHLFTNADSIANELMNIAPHGDYEKLIEDAPGMADFLKTEVVKPEYWSLSYIDNIHEQVFQLVFFSSAVDDGETFKGYVVMNFSGKIMHAFCNGDN